jgi:hypothetical protein
MLGSVFASGCPLNLQSLGCFLPQNVHGLLVLKFPASSAVFHVLGDGLRSTRGEGLRSTFVEGRRSTLGEGRRSTLGEGRRSTLGEGRFSGRGDDRRSRSLDFTFGLSRRFAVFGYSSSLDRCRFWVTRA